MAAQHLSLKDLKEIIRETVFDPADLVGILEISIEELMHKFPEKIKQHRDEFEPQYNLFDDDEFNEH